jgi:hypothetical protein
MSGLAAAPVPQAHRDAEDYSSRVAGNLPQPLQRGDLPKRPSFAWMGTLMANSG